MKHVDRRRYEMFVRVRNFQVSRAHLFPESTQASAAFAIVAQEVQQLEALDVAERSASLFSRADRKDDARKVLVDGLARAEQTAGILARTQPQLAAQFDLPAPVDDTMLLTVARQFATNAAPYAAQFATLGMSVAELEQQTAAFEDALHERVKQRDDRVHARARIEASVVRAFDAVRTLDVIIANQLAGDPVTLAAWKDARRVRKTTRSRTAAPDQTGAEPAPVNGSAPAAPAPPAVATQGAEEGGGHAQTA
jgi:hypothetical protein